MVEICHRSDRAVQNLMRLFGPKPLFHQDQQNPKLLSSSALSVTASPPPDPQLQRFGIPAQGKNVHMASTSSTSNQARMHGKNDECIGRS